MGVASRVVQSIAFSEGWAMFIGSKRKGKRTRELYIDRTTCTSLTTAN